MASDSVAINPGHAGEHPGTSRVAGLLACFFSRGVCLCCHTVWCRLCKPLGKKNSRTVPALNLRGGEGERGAGGFGNASRKCFSEGPLLHLTVFKINRNRRKT